MSCSFLSLSPGWRWNLKTEDGPHFVKGFRCAFFVAEKPTLLTDVSSRTASLVLFFLRNRSSPHEVGSSMKIREICRSATENCLCYVYR